MESGRLTGFPCLSAEVKEVKGKSWNCELKNGNPTVFSHLC